MHDDRLFAKCAARLIPFLMVLYVVNFLDRNNVGFAALTMNQDLGISAAAFGFGAGVFFVGYSLFQVPANLALARIGARRWLAVILFVWGAISASTAFVQGATSLYIVRFLLGAAEAGFVPGVFFYLTLWFPPAYRARFIASFMAAAPLSGVIGGPLSGYILGFDGVMGLKSWQLLFLVEGLPACLLAFAVLSYLSDGPGSASFLSSDEKRAIAARLEGEAPHTHGSLASALLDPRVIALGLVNFGVLAGANGVSLWLPQIVKGMGFSTLLTGFIVALPNLVSVFVMILWGRSSDSHGERVFHVAIPAGIAAASFLTGSLLHVDGVVLVTLALTQIMLWSAIAPLIALPPTFLSGPARAAGIALVVSIGQIGGFLGSWIIGVLKDATNDYAASMAVIGFTLIAAAGIVVLFGRGAPLRAAAQPSR